MPTTAAGENQGEGQPAVTAPLGDATEQGQHAQAVASAGSSGKGHAAVGGIGDGGGQQVEHAAADSASDGGKHADLGAIEAARAAFVAATEAKAAAVAQRGSLLDLVMAGLSTDMNVRLEG